MIILVLLLLCSGKNNPNFSSNRNEAQVSFKNVGPTFGSSHTVSRRGFLEQIPLDMAPNSIAKTSFLIHTYYKWTFLFSFLSTRWRICVTFWSVNFDLWPLWQQNPCKSGNSLFPCQLTRTKTTYVSTSVCVCVCETEIPALSGHSNPFYRQ